jgi:glycosyltransferase involved in cell wall biosynthesis
MIPLISVKIPTYNCAEFLIQTINSILNQRDFDLDLLEIEVVDDCSTKDYPEVVVTEYGNGRIKFYRQPENVGAVRNFNTCIQRSSCKYVHILHGDDMVCPSFYKTILEDIDNFEVVMCRSFVIDENSMIQDISPQLDEIKTAKDLYYTNPIRTPGVFAELSVYQKIGLFDESLVHVADWDMWVRMVENCTVKFISNPNNLYRMFSNSDTSRLVRTGANIEDHIRFCEILAKREDFNKIQFLKICRTMALNQAKSFDQKEFRSANYNYFKLLNSLIYGHTVGWLYPVYMVYNRKKHHFVSLFS